MKASEFFTRGADSLKAIGKMLLLSRRTVRPHLCGKGGDSIVILGNGPSLKQLIASEADKLRAMPSMGVNFMANTPAFGLLKPDYYLLADPHFYTGLGNANVDSMWRALAYVQWPMTLCVAAPKVAEARRLTAGGSGNLSLASFNFVGIEGYHSLENAAFSLGLAMPRPRNVLIPAIMAAIAMGYKEIYITGADHSWTETLRVTDENHVVSVQPHFYADSTTELKRSEVEYRNYRLHDILYSWSLAFRAYHTIRRYADRLGVRIYNATPGSFIDAFERRSL